MSKSLRSKLVFIMLLLIVLLMTVVCVFLISGVQRFYTNEFYSRMETVFTNSSMVSSLRSGARGEDPVAGIENALISLSGQLGIDVGTRNYYILDGTTGKLLKTSSLDEGEQGRVEITPNILKALAGGESLSGSSTARYMDVAVPITGDDGTARYVVYIRDNKQNVQALNSEIFTLILEAVLVGLVISVAVSLLLSVTLLQPIRGMTKAAEEMADGDFSRTIPVESEDEIGILSQTFNNMASQIETMLAELKKSETIRREFVANVSHELRTPLTGIRTYTETLADNPDLSPEQTQEFLQVILRESDRMSKIVLDLLELSRFDSGNSRLLIERFSLEQSVREVYRVIALEAQHHRQNINLELEWKLPMIMGDKMRIEQVLMNIVSNAVKYTPDGGDIDISGGRTGEYVWVRVQDTGIGIPESDLPRVFDRFYRVDKARSRERGGTGLGLSIAHDIVSLHGGEITVESAQGEGTTMTVFLPIEGPKDE